MTIAEMHVWFRQYAQQMGMQNVRAILPEQIDLIINTSITDTVNQVITQNIGVTNDRIITDNSKIGQINALRSLYKVKNVNADVVDKQPYNIPINDKPFIKGSESYISRIYSNLSDFDLIPRHRYYTIEQNESKYVAVSITKADYDAASSEQQLIANVTFWPTVSSLETAENYGKYIDYRDFTGTFDYLYLVDLSINYKHGDKITNYFPVRLIDDAYLADTLNDFVLRPRLRTPIAVIYNGQLDLYIDVLDANGNLPQNLATNELRVSYLAKPAQVKYQSDIGGEDVNCDLPDYMHVDILKHAVDLYRAAVSGGMYGAQQQQQAQNREIARNNARPDNEGYQS